MKLKRFKKITDIVMAELLQTQCECGIIVEAMGGGKDMSFGMESLTNSDQEFIDNKIDKVFKL